MNRITVIQSIINTIRARTYLEIGVAKGMCFFAIKARRKIAVDPEFIFSKKRKFKNCILNPWNIFNKYFPVTSDAFFTAPPPMLIEHGIDVAFVDGLHTHEQSLKDVEHILGFLHKNGVIILHDCNPTNKEAAVKANSYDEARGINGSAWKGEWSGDVWKTIPYLRASHKELDIFVLECDYGLGIITKNEAKTDFKYSSKEIKTLNYADLEKNRHELLNLKKESYFQEFIKIL